MVDIKARPRLLDLFCGAGGAGMGYHRAGFDVVGVDINPQPHYPFEFHQADALTFPLEGFDAIHASPPCQAYTTMSNRWRGRGSKADEAPDLLLPTWKRLDDAPVPIVIENVSGARTDALPLVWIRLHGGMFGLQVHRPRIFWSTILLDGPPPSARASNPVGVYGQKPDGRRLYDRKDGSTQRAASSLQEAQEAMGMDWADWYGTKEAVPPAYTEHIGLQLIKHLRSGHG